MIDGVIVAVANGVSVCVNVGVNVCEGDTVCV